MPETPLAVDASSALKLRRVAAWRGIRVLAWDGGVLYGCRGYQIVCHATLACKSGRGCRVGTGRALSSSLVEESHVAQRR
jgi:hypothetical protein